MSQHYCRECAARQGWIDPPLPSNLTGSQYQVDKFLKHTLPTNTPKRTGVFDDPSYPAFADYMISSSMSGSVEVDDSGRTNHIWYAGKRVGATFENGQPVLPNDAVKLVLSHSSQSVHGYPVSSTGYSTRPCDDCGRPVLT
jgi:hypothetical protein